MTETKDWLTARHGTLVFRHDQSWSVVLTKAEIDLIIHNAKLAALTEWLMANWRTPAGPLLGEFMIRYRDAIAEKGETCCQ